MVQTGVQAFQDGLRGEVEFVEEDPVALFEGLQEGAVAPGELAASAALNREVGAKEVGNILKKWKRKNLQINKQRKLVFLQ